MLDLHITENFIKDIRSCVGRYSNLPDSCRCNALSGKVTFVLPQSFGGQNMCHSQEYCEKENQQRHLTFMAILLQQNVFYQMICHVRQCWQTRKHFSEKHCFLSMFCHVSQCGQTRKHFCGKHCFLSMFCHVFQFGQTRKHFYAKHRRDLLVCLGLDPGKFLNVYTVNFRELF